MASAQVVLHELAVDEARAAHHWYLARSPAAADAFLNELDHAVEQISGFPNTFPTHVAGTRRFLLNRFPFRVVYAGIKAKLRL